MGTGSSIFGPGSRLWGVGSRIWGAGSSIWGAGSRIWARGVEYGARVVEYADVGESIFLRAEQAQRFTWRARFIISRELPTNSVVVSRSNESRSCACPILSNSSVALAIMRCTLSTLPLCASN